MTQINYDISITPNPPTITLEVGIAKNKLTVTEKSHSMKVAATPSKDAIVNGELNPSLFGALLTLGAIIINAFDGAKLIKKIGVDAAKSINTEIDKQLKGKKMEFEIGDSLTHAFQIGDVPVTLSATDLELAGHKDHMLLCGNLVVHQG